MLVQNTTGLVGPALRGRGERDKFFNRLKMVGDDPVLRSSYVELGNSVVVDCAV